MQFCGDLMSNCTQEGFYLLLNPVYDRAESIRAFGPFDSLQSVLAFHDDNLIKDDTKVEQSVSDPYSRSFIEGPLFHMNKLCPDERGGDPGTFGHGIAQLLPFPAFVARRLVDPSTIW